MSDMKQCPFCAETIQAAAIVCRYCGRDLVEQAPTIDPNAPARMIRGDALGTWKCSRCGRQLHPQATGCAFCKQKFAPGDMPPMAPHAVKRGSPLVIILAACVGIVVVGAIFLRPRSGSVPRANPAQTTYRVEYQVRGTARGASLTYQSAGGSSEQKDVAVPWDMSFVSAPGQFVYVSAQNKGERGTIICNILLNGTVVKTSTSEGAYKIASCSGRI